MGKPNTSAKSTTPPPPPAGMVWDILENAWVTLDYWRWVNGRGSAPQR